MAPRLQVRLLGRSGLRVSSICLGTMTFLAEMVFFRVKFVYLFQLSFQNGKLVCDEATAKQMLDAFAQAGGNFIDTADYYTLGKSEEVIGNWLQEKNRDSFVIATKIVSKLDENDPNSGEWFVLWTS